MKKEIAQKIKNEFISCAHQTIKRIQNQTSINQSPFYKKLVPRSILKASQFERSFVTSFGQKAIESISEIIASSTSGTTEVHRQKETIVSLEKGYLESIDNHFRLLRKNELGRSPDWCIDVEDIQQASINNDKREEDKIISDLWFSRNGIEYFFSIKTVLPNIDQTGKAKSDMLKLKLSNRNHRVYLALPYNPFGEEKSDYNHNPAFKIFDMVKDDVVLIGKDYWDLLGGNGTYKKILEIADISGVETKKIINQHIHTTG